MSVQGAQIEFQAGKLIFSQGDPGGDLYFIKGGEVEVFRVENGLEISLATLREGEVLGIMTCLTREPRLASARAKTDVKAVVVMQAGIKTLISSTPPWVNTVIKDFILRVKQMDEVYARAAAKLEFHETVRYLELAAAFASGMPEVAALLVRDGNTLVDLIEAQKRLARVLGVGDADLERIFRVFVEVGLLKVDPKATTRRAELGTLERLSGFAPVARGYHAAYDALDAPVCAALLQLCERARAVAGTASDEVRIEPGDAPVDGILKLGWAKLDAGKLQFVPSKLSQAVRSVAAVHKLRALGPGPRPEAPAVVALTENF
jgi:CRP-like cAMP-binding protein